MLAEFKNNTPIPAKDFSAEEVAAGVENLRAADPKTGYEDAAIESYAVFKQLREDGVIPPGVRFQVCLPTIASVIAPLVQRDFRPAVTPIYEAALLRAIDTIQAAIPHEDLSFQIDLAADTAFWEDFELYPAWFFPDSMAQRKAYMVDYTVRMFARVTPDVELGVHNCYGDMGHRHWKEPEDLGVVAERGRELLEASSRPIQYWHLPVPVSAMGKLEAFFEPLKALLPTLREHGTELYLGVVQAGDLEGTTKRIEAAQKALGDFPFGVATECGWGRTPPEDIDSILRILREVSEPVM